MWSMNWGIGDFACFQMLKARSIRAPQVAHKPVNKGNILHAVGGKMGKMDIGSLSGQKICVSEMRF